MMTVYLKDPLDTFGAMCDKASRAVEAIDVNRAELVAFSIDRLNQTADFVVALGGHDQSGKFHIDPARQDKMARVQIGPIDYLNYFVDANGLPIWELSEALLKTIFTAVVIPYANERAWGLEEVEIQDEKGAIVYEGPRLKARRLADEKKGMVTPAK